MELFQRLTFRWEIIRLEKTLFPSGLSVWTSTNTILNNLKTTVIYRFQSVRIVPAGRAEASGRDSVR